MVFLTVPMPPISTSTTSPLFRKFGGFMNKPTPPGVPVMISDPLCSVCPWLQKAINFLTLKHRSSVLPLCLTSPLTIVLRDRLSASPSRWRATKQGPRGAYLSNDLLNVHCGTGPAFPGSLCQSRVETSLPAVYAATYSKASASETFFASLPMRMVSSPS